MIFPEVSLADRLQPNKSRLFIGAYGFEERSLGWASYQLQQGVILNHACVFKYDRPKGKNRIRELKKILKKLGIEKPKDIHYDAQYPFNIEEVVDTEFSNLLSDFEEIIVDITSMTKLLILICLCKLSMFSGTVRIVYSEAEDYAPTKKEYDEWKREMKIIANFPSRGSGPIIRTKCLSSIRMQGQPVSLIAFTSFNEQLVRYMLGTISPHRLLFINGRPPRKDYDWREKATQEIHNKLIDQYSADNPIEKGLLKRTANTLDYRDTIYKIDEIYKQFGTHERIICAATGSKMQTVGLFFSKMMHPDIHVEYPMPDSYFVKGISKGVRMVHEVIIPHFSEFLKNIVIEERKMS